MKRAFILIAMVLVCIVVTSIMRIRPAVASLPQNNGPETSLEKLQQENNQLKEIVRAQQKTINLQYQILQNQVMLMDNVEWLEKANQILNDFLAQSDQVWLKDARQAEKILGKNPEDNLKGKSRSQLKVLANQLLSSLTQRSDLYLKTSKRLSSLPKIEQKPKK